MRYCLEVKWGKRSLNSLIIFLFILRYPRYHRHIDIVKREDKTHR